MDTWPEMTRLERDIARIGIAVVSVASLIGAAVGWGLGLLTHHLLDEGRSDYPKKPR